VAASVKRVKAAVPFTIAWGFMLLGALATQLGTLGIPLGPWDALWRYGEMIGGAIQCGLLSVGFAGAVDSTKRAGERERDKIIEELERSNRVKEDFLTSMAGAMEAPVVSMERAMARAEEALSRSGDESRSADLAIARVEAARLLSSIGSIEAYVKARNGDFRFSYVKARLAEVVGSAASAARYVSDPSRVRVEVECDDSTAVIDAAALEGFLLKLCLFASARTARGVVRIEGRFGGGFVELAVSDPGDEPPAAARGAVDDPLARFEPSMGRYGAFATINLFVIRASVEAMGGSFAYSRADGRNRFSISLPDRAEASAAVGESAGAHGHGEHGGIDAVRAALVRDPAGECPSGTALVVSADEVSLASLKVALEAAGFRVIAATGADRAALAARESGVDIAIVRASLPGTSGYELCGQLRSAARPDSAPLPILLLLETDRAEDAAEAYRAGASDFVSMRSSERALVARALTLVRLKRLVEESVREARSLAEFDHLRRLGMLVAGVAHEVNTPNNAVFRDVPVLKRAWCELEPILADYFGRNPGLMIGAWDWAAARESIPEMLDDMYRASQQIRKIVDDLKSYVARPGPRPAERVDLAAACAFAARLLEQKIRAVGARVELRPSDGIFARGDPWKVAQIAVNLLENALDAVEARADPSIELRVLSRDGRAALECADSGPGIPEADLAKLFEPFFTTKGSRGGLGLGLPISRDYAREMGGDLSFRPGPSGGTVATLELPADGGSDAR
jgi:signal transduction histidine kinase